MLSDRTQRNRVATSPTGMVPKGPATQSSGTTASTSTVGGLQHFGHSGQHLVDIVPFMSIFGADADMQMRGTRDLKRPGIEPRRRQIGLQHRAGLGQRPAFGKRGIGPRQQARKLQAGARAPVLQCGPGQGCNRIGHHLICSHSMLRRQGFGGQKLELKSTGRSPVILAGGEGSNPRRAGPKLAVLPTELISNFRPGRQRWMRTSCNPLLYPLSYSPCGQAGIEPATNVVPSGIRRGSLAGTTRGKIP